MSNYKIPKVIHYCWLSNDPLPQKLANCIETWKKYCPDYEILNWNFERLGNHCPIWVKQAFETKKYAFAADWVRAFVLYNYGGIYLDSDVEILKPLDNLLDNAYVLSFEANSHETIEAAVMMAAPGMPFFKDLLSYYDGRRFKRQDGTLDTYPLPRIINEICKKKYHLKSIKSPAGYKLINGDENIINVLPAEYFSPKSLTTGKISLTDNTYTIHHFAGSWLSRWAKIRIYLTKKIGLKNVIRLSKIKRIFIDLKF